jgi:hypothetical protein
MLLLLLILLQADTELIKLLLRLSPMSLRDIAASLGMSSENLLASLSGRRPMPSGDRLALLRKICGVNSTTGYLDNSHVFYWRTKQRNQADFLSVTSLMFPSTRKVVRRDVLFADFEATTHICLLSDDFIVVLTPSVGLVLTHLQLSEGPPAKLAIKLQDFCSLPADEAKTLLNSQVTTWNSAVEYLKSINISPDQVIQWGSSLQRSVSQTSDVGHESVKL